MNNPNEKTPELCPFVTEIIIRCGNFGDLQNAENGNYQIVIENGNSKNPSPVQKKETLNENKKLDDIAEIVGESPELLTIKLVREGFSHLYSKMIEKLAIKEGIIDEKQEH